MSQPATNEEQIAYWNEKAGPKWVAYQDKLDAQIAPFATAVLDRAALRAGERVLDIGCGCGASTLEAAARVGAKGHATGADISRPMLARARERSEKMENVTFVEADAQTYAFEPASFDVVISRFGVMFFSDSAAAFKNIRKALKPGGRMTFICWRAMMENPWMIIPLGAAAQHLEFPPPPDPHAPGPFAFADGDRLKGILESAGFKDVTVEKHDRPMKIGSDGTLDEAAEFAMTLGPMSPLLVDKPEELRNKVRASIREALAPYHTARGVELDSASWLVSARNA